MGKRGRHSVGVNFKQRLGWLVLRGVDEDGEVFQSRVRVQLLWPDMSGELWEFCALEDCYLPGGVFVPAGRCWFAPEDAFLVER